MKVNNPIAVELDFDWHLTNRCNFNCVYCHPQIKRVLNRKYLDEPPFDLVIQRFDELNKTCSIYMSGGEPFLYPNFVEMCQGLTQKHFISINTNLSASYVKNFAKSIDPNKVLLINAALHQPERERLGIEISDFVEKMHLLQENNFNVTALYILYPPLLDRFVEDIKYLELSGVKSISAKVFKGGYQGRLYPREYTDEEKAKILDFAGDYEFAKPYLEGQVQFTGELCTAGQRSFKIDVTGQVHRCASVKGNYGNLYEGTFNPDTNPKPCPARKALAISQCHRYLVNSPLNLEENE